MGSGQCAQLVDAAVAFGQRVLWKHVNLKIAEHEFVVILGPNGAGKTTLLRVLLGQQRLTEGKAFVAGKPVRRGSSNIGYIPQRRTVDSYAPIRGRDLVAMGLDGHKWGIGLPSRAKQRRISAAIDAVGASSYAQAPLSVLSGGEQQRLRVAQALVTDPVLMVCDEPLVSLDMNHQQAVARLIDQARRERPMGVLFVTHEINPILPYVDRVVYIAGGRVKIGTPDEVLRTEVLSELYGSHVEVLRQNGRIIVLADEENAPHVHGAETELRVSNV
ncbi:zinc/manganese transport system ATP-binding protein [Actinobaculum suis]|uniref:ABC transporter ATP-binding protein n=1 Tax=Actinobaculum suis TaxID=1657 RepID=A0A0K9ETX0_9ACTO|nr:ABC transporter ATP-binding protein [Actinobaculum suis]KMY23583.1 ABC transporter ATP-binding protein [Actinobaculum suis]MDY5153230.1 ABC transporter ATP-binding protein [Actinobaculum suis]SDE59170.1 zinc/manganese transport system ATP-binding protein [Actinobaculum suis]